MPKVGQEPIRRAALVSATISEIGRAGSLDVTVGQIAKTAGMSTALAHYYFDSKSALFLAAMRHVLGGFGASVRRNLKPAITPRDRLCAIIDASLGPDQFEEHVVSAWLVFYVEAQRSQGATRLLRIYTRRLHSNLLHELNQLTNAPNANRVARGVAAMIDGIYLRIALHDEQLDFRGSDSLVRDYLELALASTGAQIREIN